MADISKITALNGTTYNIKDATARSSIPAAATANPLMDGSVSVGTSVKYAREDHRHPSDTMMYRKGSTIRNRNSSIDQEPVYTSLIGNLKTSEVQSAVRAIAGVGNYFYLAHLNPKYTITCNYSGSSYNNLFTNDLSTDCLIPTTDLATNPFVLTITAASNIDATDVTHLAMYVHRLDNAGRLTNYKIELLTTGTTSTSGTYTWQTVYERSNVSDPINGLTIALNSSSTYGYIYFKGIRFTISGATPYNSTNANGFAYNKLAICAFQLLNTRPAFSPANAFGALDKAGGDVFGSTTFHNGLIGDVTGKINNHTVNSDVPENAVFTDTKNTAGSTDTSSKIFLVGATSQAANPQTYSHDTAYVGADGCLYSGGTKVLTAHQDISGKADKSATVSTVTYDSTNKKLTKTINGTASDIVSVATLKTALSLVKGDVGLGNVENKSSATIRGELTKANVTDALGYTPPTSDTNTHRPIQVNGTGVLGNNTTALNLKAGSNVTITNSSGTVTIAATDTTYSSKTAASGGTDVSLVTTGEKYTWNNKLSSHQTIKQDGITGATVNRFGTCSTEAATAAKAVSITTGTFNLEAGARVSVKFSNANTANSPTLNVNSKGAKNIFHKGAKITSGSNKALLAGVVDFIYDGTQWHLIGNYIDSDSNTHRPIQVNGTEILGNNTTALNLKAGANVSVTNSSGTVTFAATQPKVSIASSAPSSASSGDIWFKLS